MFSSRIENTVQACFSISSARMTREASASHTVSCFSARLGDFGPWQRSRMCKRQEKTEGSWSRKLIPNGASQVRLTCIVIGEAGQGSLFQRLRCECTCFSVHGWQAAERGQGMCSMTWHCTCLTQLSIVSMAHIDLDESISCFLYDKTCRFGQLNLLSVFLSCALWLISYSFQISQLITGWNAFPRHCETSDLWSASLFPDVISGRLLLFACSCSVWYEPLRRLMLRCQTCFIHMTEEHSW